MSDTLAAGNPPIITVAEPTATMPGPPGTHEGNVQGAVVSVDRAAGMPPIITVGAPLIIASGNGGCADGVGLGAGG